MLPRPSHAGHAAQAYESLGRIGEGTYGVVLKCRHKATGELVAIKKFKESDDDEQVSARGGARPVIYSKMCQRRAPRSDAVAAHMRRTHPPARVPKAWRTLLPGVPGAPRGRGRPGAQVRKTALREVQLLQALRHAHIVSLLDVFRRGGRLYLVFEFVERTVLEDLERHPRGLGDRATRRIMWQLVRSVEYLHSQQVRAGGALALMGAA